jgi:hypothetical protein
VEESDICFIVWECIPAVEFWWSVIKFLIMDGAQSRNLELLMSSNIGLLNFLLLCGTLRFLNFLWLNSNLGLLNVLLGRNLELLNFNRLILKLNLVCLFIAAWAIFQLPGADRDASLDLWLTLKVFSSGISFTSLLLRCETSVLRSYPKVPWFLLSKCRAIVEEKSLFSLTRLVRMGIELMTSKLWERRSTTEPLRPVQVF